ncbi:uncharacterized protein EV420DRAFT_915156 [Desarmillaria tabescens]|uniref:Uncharacterized protein n=1 Tax=Armillaria tabescens TaxID=1929756 RepID=A0AA39MU33_ARMTA|nr:uncharacterized protein EV420DRAFT_915156 [Desarmillaria tabescens]KAK0446059.1 hypothetical protein EV420DRAFT_915156 [Desarmillaria tabescens]
MLTLTGSQTSEVSQDVIQNLRAQGEDVIKVLFQQIGATFAEMSERHTGSLDNIVMMIRHTVAVELEAVFAVVAEQQQLNTDLSVQANSRWMSIEASFVEMQHNILLLTEASSQVIKALDESTERNLVLVEEQANATRTATELVESLHRMSTGAHDELRKMNSSVILLHQSLLPRTHWAKAGFMRFLEIFLRVDAEYLGSLDRIYVFQLLSLLSGFGVHLFHGIASSFMSMLVLLYSFRSYTSRLLCSFQGDSQSSRQPTLVSQTPVLRDQGAPSSRRSRQHRHTLRVSRIPDRLCRSDPC